MNTKDKIQEKNSNWKTEKLGILLLRDCLITEKQLQEALNTQREKRDRWQKTLLGEVLINLWFIERNEFFKFLSRHNIDLDIGQLFLYNKKITEEQLEKALEISKLSPDRELEEVLIEDLKAITQEDLNLVLAQKYNIVRMKPNVSYLDPDLFNEFKEVHMKKLEFIPYQRVVETKNGIWSTKETWIILISNTDERVIKLVESLIKNVFEESDLINNNLKKQKNKSNSKLNIEFCYAPKEELDTFLEQIKEQKWLLNLSQTAKERQLKEEEKDVLVIGSNTEQKNEIITQFAKILKNAIDKDASDIHIEPMEQKLRIRFRIDGVLIHHADLPWALNYQFVKWLKSSFNFQDSHVDGVTVDDRQRIYYRDLDTFFDLRASIMPITNGDKMTIRILRQHQNVPSTSDLGMTKNIKRKYDIITSLSNGVILSTWPTGSGKSTTIHSTLSGLNKEWINIITVEDPVEYTVNGVNQTNVWKNTKISYNDAIKSALRQDPDILMFGEMRDQESAEAALTAGLTWHLLFSTLHSNDAVSAIVRLLDMWIKSHLLWTTLMSVIGQRLARKVCTECKEEYTPKKATMDYYKNYIENFEEDIKKKEIKFYKWKWCECCNNTGYKWRVWIYELLCVNNELKKAVLNESTALEIESIARKNGMTSLAEDGLFKALQWITTMEEVLRVTTKMEMPSEKRTIDELSYILDGDMSGEEINKAVFYSDTESTDNKNLVMEANKLTFEEQSNNPIMLAERERLKEELSTQIQENKKLQELLTKFEISQATLKKDVENIKHQALMKIREKENETKTKLSSAESIVKILQKQIAWLEQQVSDYRQQIIDYKERK